MLAEASEARIDRTNEMVCKMADTMQHNHSILETITKEYTKHLGDLTACRDNLIEQNKVLLNLHQQDLQDKRDMRREITDTRDRIFELLRHFGGGGVKIENK